MVERADRGAAAAGAEPSATLPNALRTLLDDPALVRVRLALSAAEVAFSTELPENLSTQAGARVAVPVVSEQQQPLGDLEVWLATDVAVPPHLVTQLRATAVLISALLASQRELAAAREQVAQASMLAERDELTGLGNRRAWIRALNAEAVRCRRHPRPATVLAVDLDGLKAVNDDRGHAAGDAMLRQAATVLSDASRGCDAVCRLGGDEFGLLAAETAEPAAAALAERLRAALAAAGIEASVGWAVSPDGTEPATAWSRADTSMYVDKTARLAHRPGRAATAGT